MSFKRRGFSIQFFSLFLIVMMLWGTVLPISTAFAEGEETPPPAVVEETPPAPEPEPEPEPEVQNTQQESQDQSGDTPGTDGEDGSTGDPAPEDTTPAEDGENGNDAGNGTPAEDGENAENGDDAMENDGPSDGEPSITDTGDASADAESVNEANTTNTNTNGSGSTDSASTTPSNVDIEVDNDLEGDVEGEANANTGDFTVKDPDGALGVSGASDALSVVFTLFNVVVTNSSGTILFLKNPTAAALDFTDRIMNLFRNVTTENGECSLVFCRLTGAIFNIITDSSAEVTQSSVARSNSGGVVTESEDGAAVSVTDKARAMAASILFGGLEVINSRYLIIVMTNLGDLDGDIILPDASFFETLSTSAKAASGSNWNLTNVVEVENNAQAHALTGDNCAIGEEGAYVNTGDAQGAASDITIANVLGAPICFVVSTGGDWNGDVYGLPETFSVDEGPMGTIICGTAHAERDAARFNASTTNYAKVLNTAIAEATTGNNCAKGLIAAVETGDAEAFAQILNLLNIQVINQDWIFALFAISGNWNGDLIFGTIPGDDDPLHDVASQLLAGAAIAGGGAPGGYTSNPDIKITKTASVSSVEAPSSVDYTITVKNEGQGVLYRSKLTDTLKDPNGDTVYTRTWNLDSIAQGEEITVTYTVEYNENIQNGVYENTAKVTGFRNSSIYVYPNKIIPATAVASVTVGPVEAAYVLPQAAESCKPLITGYLRLGAANNSEDVMNLQNFLNETEGEQLEVNGEYDAATVAAVKRFQAKYSAEVLSPWGVNLPTGHVYYTTQRKINDLACVNGETFPLSSDQIQEINSFRNRYEASPETVNPVFEGVGLRPIYEPFSLAPTAPAAAKVLLNDLAPKNVNTDTTSSAEQTLEARLGAFAWMLAFVPFVEAFELE